MDSKMFKLIYNDFTLFRNKWVFLLLLVAIESQGRLIPVAYISIVLFLVSLGLTERYKIDRLYRSLPIKRSSVVYSKYGGAFLMFVFALVLTYVIASLRTQIVSKSELIFSAHNVFAVFFPYVILVSALLPVYFKYGLELGKSRGSIMATLGLGLLVIAILFLYVIPTQGNVYDLKYSYAYLGIGMMLSVAISLKYSLKFYSLRDIN